MRYLGLLFLMVSSLTHSAEVSVVVEVRDFKGVIHNQKADHTVEKQRLSQQLDLGSQSQYRCQLEIEPESRTSIVNASIACRHLASKTLNKLILNCPYPESNQVKNVLDDFNIVIELTMACRH